jgi:hypothetical protein
MSEWTHWYVYPKDPPRPARILTGPVYNPDTVKAEVQLKSGKTVRGNVLLKHITPMHEDNDGYSALLYRERHT